MTNSVTVRSDFHRDVVRRLERLGLEVMEEVDFPPYRVDVYVPDAHAAIEVDGPHHSETVDARRDGELERVYSLWVLHIGRELFAAVDEFDRQVLSFIYQAGTTREKRWERCKDRTPWL